jgi:hypothetical protein
MDRQELDNILDFINRIPITFEQKLELVKRLHLESQKKKVMNELLELKNIEPRHATHFT